MMNVVVVVVDRLTCESIPRRMSIKKKSVAQSCGGSKYVTTSG